MKYRFMGRTGLKVSELCMGTQTFGWGAEEADAHVMASHFEEAGGNFFDTSNIYYEGQSETILGTWIKKHPDRSKLVIATRGSHAIGLVDIGQTGKLDLFGANWNNNSPTGGAIELWINQE